MDLDAAAVPPPPTSLNRRHTTRLAVTGRLPLPPVPCRLCAPTLAPAAPGGGRGH